VVAFDSAGRRGDGAQSAWIVRDASTRLLGRGVHTERHRRGDVGSDHGGRVNGYSRNEHVAAWSLVVAQLVLLAGLVFAPGSRAWSTPVWLLAVAAGMIAVGAVFAVAGALGLGSGLTASPLPSAAAQLRTTGVYGCVRHPIYSGLLLGGAGVVLLGGRLTRIWVWLALLALLWAKTRLEERELTLRFPDYRDYAAHTARLAPNPVRCLARRRDLI
jgi:protein-S-isoprenylcysteine O-methyltransferase Ste14